MKAARGLCLLATHLLWALLMTLGAARAEVQALAPLALSVQPHGQPARALEPRLPFHWDSNCQGQDGSATLLAGFERPSTAQPLAILLPRIGNGFSVELNGQLLVQRGMDRSPWHDFGKQPHWVPLPSALVLETNRLVIRIEAQRGRKAGIADVLLGPENELREVYDSQRTWRTYGVLAVSTASATLGVFGLMVWLRRRQTIYLVYALAELLWSFAMLDALMESTFLPWPLWGLVSYSAQALAAMLICRFSLMVSGVHSVWPARATTLVLAGTVPLLLLSLWAGIPALELLLLMVSQAVGIWVVAVVIRRGLRSTDVESRVLAIALCGLMLVLVRDIYVLVLRPYAGVFGSWGSHYGQYPWLRFGWVLFGLVLAWILANRMWRDARSVAEANQDLTRRLQAQQQALEASFQRDLEIEKQQVQAQERQRLTRDMHDGIGAHLAGVLRVARQEVATPAVVVTLLEEAMDQLKLGIDVMHAPDATLESVLGSLRYRLEPRFRAAGVKLHWSVEELPELKDWTVDKARHVQMIFFEAFSNTVQHSGASEARFTAACLPAQGVCRLSLWDNGRAQDMREREGPPTGHGLRNMHWRADHLLAPLKIDFAPGGTRVELDLTIKTPLPGGLSASQGPPPH
jgi:signal transduction histidine kinase